MKAICWYEASAPAYRAGWSIDPAPPASIADTAFELRLQMWRKWSTDDQCFAARSAWGVRASIVCTLPIALI